MTEYDIRDVADVMRRTADVLEATVFDFGKLRVRAPNVFETSNLDRSLGELAQSVHLMRRVADVWEKDRRSGR